MTSLVAPLARSATTLHDPSLAQQEMLAKAKLTRLRERLDVDLLRVAVLGQFKRGESTLLNALLSVPVLPTGEREIAFATRRRRLTSLVGELLFQRELELKALLKPQQDLQRKASAFEQSAARFESERQALCAFLSVDRKRVMAELDAETDRIWNQVRKELRELMGRISARPFEETRRRNEITAALSRFFEHALRDAVDLFGAKLGERLAIHRGQVESC